MAAKKFLTIFGYADFGPVLLGKDVGAIPYYLSATCGWDSALAFFESEDVTLGSLTGSEYSRQVSLVSLGQRRGPIRNALRIISFLVRRGNEYDVLNFYHDGTVSFLHGLLFKLVKRGGVVYLKLDLSELHARRHIESSKRFLPGCFRRAKYLLSRLAVDLYTTETTRVYELLAGDYYFRNRLRFLPNGFTKEGDEDPRQWMAAKDNVILTVGRLGDTPKHNELLVDAVAGMDKALLDGWKVWFVGPVVAESFRRHVDDAVARAPHLKEMFVFTGKIEDRNRLYDIYRKSRIFCLTSRWESFGFVVPEAMYFGNYVISSDLPAPRDLTDDGALGSLFPPGDVDALRGMLADAVSGKIDLAAKGLESHLRIKTRYDWRSIVAELDRMLRGAGNR